MKITTTTGVILDDEKHMAKALNEYINRKELENTKVFYTSLNTYLIVYNSQPEFENQVAEEIAVHLDIMKMQQKP